MGICKTGFGDSETKEFYWLIRLPIFITTNINSWVDFLVDGNDP